LRPSNSLPESRRLLTIVGTSFTMHNNCAGSPDRHAAKLAPKPSLIYLHFQGFQQLGGSAFRSKATQVASTPGVLSRFCHGPLRLDHRQSAPFHGGCAKKVPTVQFASESADAALPDPYFRGLSSFTPSEFPNLFEGARREVRWSGPSIGLSPLVCSVRPHFARVRLVARKLMRDSRHWPRRLGTRGTLEWRR